jgi:serine/threonine-protein kinase
VWVARNEATGAEVAIKVLLAREIESPEAAARFRREAYASAQLAHRGIVRVFDLVDLGPPNDGSLVMVMELLRGQTLADRMDRQARFTVEEMLHIVVPLLSALTHAHRAGIIHRDLKPENVFLAVDPDGHVTPKILDFGISKLTNVEVPKITGDGTSLGTPSYMSPEQARGASDVDARSDVFTVGILMYEMLAGQNPFMNDSYHAVIASILERDPEPIPDLPEGIAAVLKLALAKKREDRFASAADLSAALRAAVVQAGGVFDVDRSAPAWSGAAFGQAPGLAATVDGMSMPAVTRGRVSDPTELSPRTFDKRERGRRRVGFLLGTVLTITVLGVGAIVWKVKPLGKSAVADTNSGAAARTDLGGHSAAAAGAQGTGTASAAGSPSSAEPGALGLAPANTAANVDLNTTLKAAASASAGTPTNAIVNADTAASPLANANGAPASAGSPRGAARGPARPVSTTNKPSSHAAGVIKDPGF